MTHLHHSNLFFLSHLPRSNSLQMTRYSSSYSSSLHYYSSVSQLNGQRQVSQTHLASQTHNP
uniref:Uncharacterized protein n=1 Tax=Medicago truncatula TaxID=3880 RepID=I3STW2_MEDTR|nr:unknown [Medicago truncatula]